MAQVGNFCPCNLVNQGFSAAMRLRQLDEPEKPVLWTLKSREAQEKRLGFLVA